ncbi:hypothetical protein OFO99_32775, partial [Escherichia coli]|nr:hypothetical protein [Escherichia coli]
MKKLESLTPTLEAWKADSTIESYQSLSRYLSSVERQQQDYQLIRDLYATQSSPLASGLSLSKKPKMDADFIPVTVDQYLQNPVS